MKQNIKEKVIKDLMCNHPSFGFELKHPLDPGYGTMEIVCSKCGRQKKGNYVYSPAGLMVSINEKNVVEIISQPQFGGVTKYEIDGSSVRNI